MTTESRNISQNYGAKDTTRRPARQRILSQTAKAWDTASSFGRDLASQPRPGQGDRRAGGEHRPSHAEVLHRGVPPKFKFEDWTNLGVHGGRTRISDEAFSEIHKPPPEFSRGRQKKATARLRKSPSRISFSRLTTASREFSQESPLFF